MTDTTHWLACVANTIEDLEGEVFSPECLAEMARGTGEVPVELEFRHEVGRALWFGFDWGKGELQCRMDTDRELELGRKELYPVLGFTYEGIENGEYVGIKITSVGLTDKPASLGTWMRKMRGEGLYDR